jgi:hypothetical protein
MLAPPFGQDDLAMAFVRMLAPQVHGDLAGKLRSERDLEGTTERDACPLKTSHILGAAEGSRETQGVVAL